MLRRQRSSSWKWSRAKTVDHRPRRPFLLRNMLGPRVLLMPGATGLRSKSFVHIGINRQRCAQAFPRRKASGSHRPVPLAVFEELGTSAGDASTAGQLTAFEPSPDQHAITTRDHARKQPKSRPRMTSKSVARCGMEMDTRYRTGNARRNRRFSRFLRKRRCYSEGGGHFFRRFEVPGIFFRRNHRCRQDLRRKSRRAMSEDHSPTTNRASDHGRARRSERRSAERGPIAERPCLSGNSARGEFTTGVWFRGSTRTSPT